MFNSKDVLCFAVVFG